jgi:hypothetical protein
MNDKEEIFIKGENDGAVFKEDISGWVSRNGRFYGKDEKLARYDGSTHSRCECGSLITKSWICCEGCRAQKRKERYNSLPLNESFAGDTPCADFDGDEYFFDQSSLFDYMFENDLTPEMMMLVDLKDAKLRTVDDDYFLEDGPEEVDVLPANVAQKLEELNQAIRDFNKDGAIWFEHGPNRIKVNHSNWCAYFESMAT